jgi:hypothetical protein
MKISGDYIDERSNQALASSYVAWEMNHAPEQKIELRWKQLLYLNNVAALLGCKHPMQKLTAPLVQKELNLPHV